MVGGLFRPKRQDITEKEAENHRKIKLKVTFLL